MFLYFVDGDPREVVAPDAFVVVGAPKQMGSSYKLWEEPKAPGFVLEITSRSTREEDQGRKLEVYASLAVGEFRLFYPMGDHLAPHALPPVAARPVSGRRSAARGEYAPHAARRHLMDPAEGIRSRPVLNAHQLVE